MSLNKPHYEGQLFEKHRTTAQPPVKRIDFVSACISNSAAILVAHNHPSGDPTPSTEDMTVTKRLDEACRILGIDFLDHLVIGANCQFGPFDNEGGFHPATFYAKLGFVLTGVVPDAISQSGRS